MVQKSVGFGYPDPINIDHPVLDYLEIRIEFLLMDSNFFESDAIHWHA